MPIHPAPPPHVLIDALPDPAGLLVREVSGWVWAHQNAAGAARWLDVPLVLHSAIEELAVGASCEVAQLRVSRLDQDHALCLAIAPDASAARMAELVLDELPNPVFVKDTDHRWVLVNRAFCELLGLPREALLGKSDYDFFPTEQADTFWAKDEEVFSSGKLNVNEEPLTNTEGELRWLLTRKTPTGQGEARLLIGVITDITDRKRAEARLVESISARERAEAASRAKSAFLANMSHELRTPLNAIIGYGEIVMEEIHIASPEEAARDVDRILTSARHLLRLVDGALDMTRIEAGRVALRVESVAIDALCEELERMIHPTIAQTGNRFILELPEQLDLLRTDRERLLQALSHLLDNAAKFTQHGEVTLRVVEEGDQVAFHVSDTGIGIPAHRLEAIFELFTQIDETSTRRFGGTGLGLTLARRSCQLLGGDVTVQSVPGRGSTFTARVARHLIPAPQQAATLEIG